MNLHYKGIGDTILSDFNLCGKHWGHKMIPEKGFLAEPQKTETTKGQHDFNTCGVCQNTRKTITDRLKAKYDGTYKKDAKPFPECCTWHKNLKDVKEFDRNLFNSVPEMVADKIIFTKQHIINNIRNLDYYEDITDYIDYTVLSFGKMPKNCGESLFLSSYFHYIAVILNNNAEFDKERKNKLLEYLKTYTTKRKTSQTDLNTLISTWNSYKKVYKFL